MVDDGTYSYGYDGLDRLVSVIPDNPVSGSTQEQYTYDSQGRRLSKQVETFDGCNWNLSNSREYLWDTNNLVAELDGLNNNALLKQYTWGPAGLLAVTDYTQTPAKTYVPVADASGNIVELLDPTATANNVVASYHYDLFGNLLSASGSAAGICPFQAKRYYVDAETPWLAFAGPATAYGTTRVVYLPGGFWMQRDPASPIAGAFNEMEYVGDDPINNSDANGLAPTRNVYVLQIPAAEYEKLNLDFSKPAYVTFGGVRYRALEQLSSPQSSSYTAVSNIGRFFGKVVTLGIADIPWAHSRDYYELAVLPVSGDEDADTLAQLEWRKDRFKSAATQVIAENKYFEVLQFGIPAVVEAAGGALALRSAVTQARSATGGVGAPTAPHPSQLGADFSAKQVGPIRQAGSIPGGGARFGQATTSQYRATFFAAHPEVEGKVIVHHAVEQQVLTKFPGVVTQAEIHSLENLRGVPIGVNTEVHLRQIRTEWNAFYRPFEASGTAPTKAQLLQKATEIDSKYGSAFIPPVRGAQ